MTAPTPELLVSAGVGRRRVSLWIGLGVIAAIGLISAAAPLIAPYDPTVESVAGLDSSGEPLDPSLSHPLGTDPKGRDLLSRLIYGGRVTFVASAASIVMASTTGLILGLFAAAPEVRRISGPLMRTTDIGLAIPGLLLATAIVSVLGSGIPAVTIALAAVFWAPIARITYGQAIVIRELPFVEAAITVGVGRARLMYRHVLPHVMPVVIAWSALAVGWAALFESALGFLGVGVEEPTASVGAMLGCCLVFYREHPGLILFPALYLGLFVFATTVIGESLHSLARQKA